MTAGRETRPMIIDSHAHIFQHWAEACGHPSREIHRKFMQKVQTRPAAKVFRVRDGQEVTGALLYREGDNSWAGLKDVDFRPWVLPRCREKVEPEPVARGLGDEVP